MVGKANMLYFDLFRQIKITGHLLGSLTGADTTEGRLSSARMRILMRLAVEKKRGGVGLSPSDLSRFLGVSRNTVSALLNGLEDQNLVARDLHPTDRRQFIITLTPEGENVYTTHSPKFAHYLEQIFSALTHDEQNILLDLLTKLNAGMKQQLDQPNTSSHQSDPTCEDPPS